MSKRNVYVVQPYEVGPKVRKSLALIIPSKIVKDYDIDNNTIFILKPENYSRIILSRIKDINSNNKIWNLNTNCQNSDNKELSLIDDNTGDAI